MDRISPRSPIFLALVAVWAVAPCAGAAVCAVPSANHPTIQSAVDDMSCDELDLAAQVFVESVAIDRDVVLHGVATDTTVIEGQVVVSAGTVVLADLTIDASASGGFASALDVGHGARVSGVDLVVRHGTMLFGDGFESGDTSAWSSTVP